jgi:hypothetical protein
MASLLRVLVCAEKDWRPDLAPTLIGRQGIEVYRVEKFADAKLVGSSLNVQLILVDRDLPEARVFVDQLRKEPTTQRRSIGILARGAMEDIELELLQAGANAVFRLPADAEWDTRISRLLKVPERQQARLVVHLAVDTAPETAGAILNLSTGGMLLATHQGLHVSDELGFRFRLPDGSLVAGRGRVARSAAPTGYGVEFLEMGKDDRDAVNSFLRSARIASA